MTLRFFLPDSLLLNHTNILYIPLKISSVFIIFGQFGCMIQSITIDKWTTEDPDQFASTLKEQFNQCRHNLLMCKTFDMQSTLGSAVAQW